jgi:hypothetical protein
LKLRATQSEAKEGGLPACQEGPEETIAKKGGFLRGGNLILAHCGYRKGGGLATGHPGVHGGFKVRAARAEARGRASLGHAYGMSCVLSSREAYLPSAVPTTAGVCPFSVT